MTIRIGYIGSAHSVAKTKQLASEIDTITVLPYVYDHPTDVPALYKEAQQQADVICFSGIVPYYHRGEFVDEGKPTVITPFHEYMVVTSLLTCLVQHTTTLQQLSIDLPSAHMLLAIEKTIGEKINRHHVIDYAWIYDMDGEHDFPFTDIVSFHKHLYQSGQTKMAITSIHYAYDQLKQAKVPVIYMTDYDVQLKQVLIDAEQHVRYAQMSESMIATLSITKESGVTKQDDINIQSLLHTIVPLHDLGEDNQVAHYYTTRGVIEKRILQQTSTWIEQMEGLLQDSFSFGIGYGNQLFDAQQYAKQALQAATKIKTSNGYIVNDDNQLIGPLVGESMIENLRHEDDALHELMTTSQTNVKTMQRFIEFMDIHNFNPFTAHELAIYANVTVRTTERFIKKLLSAHIIYSHGQEQHVQQGRPRTVYALKSKVEQKFRSFLQGENQTIRVKKLLDK